MTLIEQKERKVRAEEMVKRKEKQPGILKKKKAG